MRYLLSDGRYIGEGTPFTFNDIQYPANWLNLASVKDLADIGAKLVTYTNERADDRFYTVTESVSGAEVTYINTPKDLFECQNRAVSDIKKTAYSILQPSDWMVVKGIETKAAVPTTWNDWRQQIRTQAAAQVAAIKACTSVEELAKLPQVQWALDPNQPVTPVAPAEVTP
jgi:hypothetical protein